MKDLVITVKTLYGFEDLITEELSELGYNEVEKLNRAVQLNGDWEDVYRLNYHCRLAISVLVKVKSFTIHKEEDLYKAAKKIDWPAYFDVDKTFAVKGAVFSTLFTHTQYPFLLVKDAIADVFREKFGKRPDVNVKAPQVMFDVYIKEKTVVISLNTSGVPLFQRGYRQEVGDAPMNEVLAAGILRMSGWDKKSTLIDPMCGSGTIAIEAALWAADIPAMIERSHFAFKNFKSFDAEAWEKVRNEGNKRPIKLGFDILASDIDGDMIKKARRNSRMAPIGNMIQWNRKDVLELEAPDGKGIMICNPPYGERMGEEVEELYTSLGDLFKQKFLGYDCWVVSSNIDALKNLGLKPNKKIKVYNGSLECSLRQFQIFAGTKKYDNSETEADGSPAKPKGVRRAKQYKPKEKTEPEKSVEEEETSQSKASEKEYNPTRKVIETPKTEPRKSAASKYGKAKSAYLPKSEDKKQEEEPEISSKKEQDTSKSKDKIETEEKRGASKYGQKPKFLKNKYTSAAEEELEKTPKQEDEKPSSKEETSKESMISSEDNKAVDPQKEEKSENQGEDKELSLKEKIEQMKRYRKRD